jgi:hypothetical protein
VRTFIVYLGIAALLVCPYDCAVKYAAAQSVGGENEIACCERCAAHEAAEHSPAGSGEHQPKPADDGKNCLCEGAVFDGVTRSDVEIVLQCSLLPCIADTAVAPSLVSFSPGLKGGGTPIDDEGGRSMRISMRSLQL